MVLSLRELLRRRMRTAALVKMAWSFYECLNHGFFNLTLHGGYDLGGRSGCATRKSEDLRIRAACRHVEARLFQRRCDCVNGDRLRVRAQFHTVQCIRSRHNIQ